MEFDCSQLKGVPQLSSYVARKMRRLRSTEPQSLAVVVGVILVVAVIRAALCGPLFQFCLWRIAGKDIPWYADALCGLVAAEVVAPLAIVLWVLGFFVEPPYLG